MGRLTIAIWLAAALASPGCRKAPSPPRIAAQAVARVPAQPSAATVPGTQTAGSLAATLAVDPQPPTPMQETTLRLALRDAAGRPVEGRKVCFDLTMPAMAMPPNRPVAREEGRGVYRAAALFTMAGEWEIRATVSSAGTDEVFAFRLKTR